MSEIIEDTDEFQAEINSAAQTMTLVETQLCTGLVGTGGMAKLVTDTYFAGQHLLIEGVPGVGKTETAKKLSHAIGGLVFGRVQGAPDKQPFDIIGLEFFNRKTDEFEPRHGAMFADVLLLDELNRMNTKTQAALYDALSEGHAMIGNTQYDLPRGFYAVGTQNPNATGQGTFPISDPLRDRFGASIYVGSPSVADRIAVGSAFRAGTHNTQPNVILRGAKVDGIKVTIAKVAIEEDAIELVANAFNNLSQLDGVEMKADGHRSMISALTIARAHAVRNGKVKVTTDNVNKVLPYIMRHRFEVDADPSELEAAKQERIEASIRSAA